MLMGVGKQLLYVHPKVTPYPYSRLLYSAVTQYLGFKPNEEEYIVMGMSAFSEPRYNYEYLLYENNHRL